MIETILGLFQMQIKSVCRDSIELLQASFAKRPKTFYPVNVRVAVDEFISRMINAKMLRVADINQPVVAAPFVRVNNRVQANTPANDCLQRFLAAVRDNLGINRSRPRLKMPKTLVLPPAPRPRLPLTRLAPN